MAINTLYSDTRYQKILGVVGIALFVMGFLIISRPSYSRHAQHSRDSQTVISHCTTEQTCEEEEHYRQMVKTSGTREAFAALKNDYNQKPIVKTNCHQLTHAIGRTAGEKFASVSAAYAEGDEFCSSGYYHGVMESILSRLKPEAVPANLSNLCNDIRGSKQYSLAHHNCTHGLGHGLMLITGHELFEALALCDNFADAWEQQSCYGGAFMENIMASLTPNHTTKYINADEPLYPCSAVSERYKQECYIMQSSHILPSVGNDFAQTFAICSDAETQFKAICYQSIGRDASGFSISDIQATKKLCDLGHNVEAVTNCIIGAVKDIAYYHHSDVQAKDFCNQFSLELSATCLLTLDWYYKTF